MTKGDRFLFGVMKMLKNMIVVMVVQLYNILKAIELYTLNWVNVLYVDYSSIKLFKNQMHLFFHQY